MTACKFIIANKTLGITKKITFYLNAKYNLYIDFLEGKDKEQEVIDFLDVTKGEIDSKKFIISLTEKNGKTQKVTLILEELLIDFFAQNFMEFLEKARDSVL